MRLWRKKKGLYREIADRLELPIGGPDMEMVSYTVHYEITGTVTVELRFIPPIADRRMPSPDTSGGPIRSQVSEGIDIDDVKMGKSF